MTTELTQTQVVVVSDTAIQVITAGVQGAAGAGGVTDHGGLTGLSDDDHTHYYNQARGDARYSQLSHTHTASNITDFSESVDDRVAALLVAGANVTLTYNDGAGTLTVASSGGGGGSPGGSSGQVQYNNASAFGGAAALTYAASGTNLTVTAQNATDKPLAVVGASSQTANLAEFQNNSGAAFFTVGAPTLAGDSATKNFLNLTGTLPATTTAVANAINVDITTAGSSGFQQNGLTLALNAGYTGTSPVNGIQITNSVAGTGASYGSASATLNYRTGNSNCAFRATTSSTTVGINNGGQQLAAGSSVANYGSWCSATSSLNTPALNVGVIGTALNATTSTAGAFMLIGSGTPSFANTALLADNGATTGDIFTGRDNGTVKFKIADGGDVTVVNFSTAGAVRNNSSGLLSSDANLIVKQGTTYIATPSNTTIPLISSARYPFTINGVYNLKTSSGTITAAIQINGTNVTSLSGLSVTSTPQSPTASGANTVAIGDRVTLVLSSNASAAGLEFTMKGTL